MDATERCLPMFAVGIANAKRMLVIPLEQSLTIGKGVLPLALRREKYAMGDMNIWQLTR